LENRIEIEIEGEEDQYGIDQEEIENIKKNEVYVYKNP